MLKVDCATRPDPRPAPQSDEEQGLQHQGFPPSSLLSAAPGLSQAKSEQLDVRHASKLASSVTYKTAAQLLLLTSPGDEVVAKLSFWARTKNTFEVTAEVVRRFPSTVIVPVVLFCILAGLGIYGCVAGARSVEDNDKVFAISSATDVGTGFILQVEEAFAPLIGLQAYILQNPNISSFLPVFPSFSQSLMDQLPQGTIAELQVSPMGNVIATYPENPSHLGLDIFNTPSLRAGAIDTLQLNKMVLSGPLNLAVVDGGPTTFGGIARLPIFVQNATKFESWGFNQSFPTNCLAAANTCYAYAWLPETGSKFWGFVTAIISFVDLTTGADSRLSTLTKNGYKFKLVRPASAGDIIPNNETEYIIANSSSLPEDPISVQLNISNGRWTLYVSQNGWSPSWLTPVLIAVVIISFLIACLVAFALIAKKQQEVLLGEVLVANNNLAATTCKLAEEKVRTDALLVRQFNLIQCFDKDKGDGGGDADNSTMDRIEVVRRQLNKDNIKSLADTETIVQLELLGQGMFGKVYKGLWRGTEVAIKTMVLPANMSGAEKREKMAVMEAAISSSLAHPNIVQTYTYNIKPVVEARAAGSIKSSIVAGQSQRGPGGGGGGAQVLPNTQASAMSNFTGQTSTAIHSYEISMVLEYCDKGALRDALDNEAFYTSDGLNYRGILDVLSDVAKAMLHLHSTQVLHSDLKASNVMLKSSGEPRSVMAKVADFGLSVRVDHMETHISNVYQGTLTHMAPEILLDGHISKAADVYAFGITMWEVFTSDYAYQGTPRALLGHQITREHLRPKFPLACPTSFRGLAERCWSPKPTDRPPFESVLSELIKMRAELEGPSPAIKVDMEKQAAVAAAAAATAVAKEEAKKQMKLNMAVPRSPEDDREKLVTLDMRTGVGSAESCSHQDFGILVGGTGDTTLNMSGFAAAGIFLRGMDGTSLGTIGRGSELPPVMEGKEDTSQPIKKV